ncbi:hypothetical protein LX87_05502 [Larkinella arboricola]|uniref:Uncharacterized protein n=1 Tax=Larkinella arboricola TaxID=643671 RepID=A0A327WJ23_LARAB|nr:hypothetical protein [Larkinella arboricola]RAJ90073.1 hypothetical protein LX87_05502 [Larkinella arboricola]
MKKLSFDIYSFNQANFFPHSRVKTKLQVIFILLEAMRYIMSYSDTLGEGIKCTGKLSVIVDKMSRIVFSIENKYYSIVLPFYVYSDGDQIQFYYKHEAIDSKLLSNLITILKGDSFNSKNSLDFSDSVIDLENENEMLWMILQDLILYEDGYIRYDVDEESYKKAKEEGCEHTHPLNHCDLFYSSNASLKLGLDRSLEVDEFIDVLNTRTNCKYLRNWR